MCCARQRILLNKYAVELKYKIRHLKKTLVFVNALTDF